MTDLTGPLTELRAAYRAYQNAKRDKKEEIQEKYRTRMEDEIRAAVQAEKYAFASLLKDRKEFHNLRVTDIQDHVLRTRNWKVWEDIRDFADIAPEQITRENARRTANASFHWSDDLLTLTVTKDSKNKELPTPVVFDMTTNRKVQDRWWPESGTPEENGVSEAERVAKKQDPAFLTFVSIEIQRAIDAGEISTREDR
jgi:hypothetical protein